jgi:catechol 2,3-dioxygenase-like lactoylglutathione lyase family enzyme
MTYAPGMEPMTLDHVALWVTERDAIADIAVAQLGMHVIDRTDAFTLVGADARRGKLTLFAAEGPREQGALKHIGWRVPGIAGPRELELPDGIRIVLVEGEHDLDHVALFSAVPEETAAAYQRLGFAPAPPGPEGPRVEVGGALVELHPGEPGNPERPLLNHLAVLVESTDEHIAGANDLGIEIDNVVDAANTYAVFLRGPEHVRVEYVEHKPTFSLM